MEVKRDVFCEDAVAWLKAQPILVGSSLVASLPDISEFPSYSLAEWKNWFVNTAELILSKCPDDGMCIFYQSDIKHDGAWVDKAYLCQKAAEALGVELLLHKVVARVPAGTITYGRPSFSHLLFFSRGLRMTDLSKSTPDIVVKGGRSTWQRGMGIETCLLVCKIISEFTPSRCVVNPFCGEGSVLAAANHLKLSAIGIERNARRAERSRQQTILASRVFSTNHREPKVF